jgi:hypothetical protein
MSNFDSPASSRCASVEVREQLLSVEVEPGTGLHDEADPLAETLVGNGHHGRLRDAVVPQRVVLDLRWEDVVTTPDDHVLLAPGNAQVARLVHTAEVAGEEPARGVEAALGGRLVVEVAEHGNAPRPPICPVSPGGRSWSGFCRENIRTS